jgi:hypothetical protein
VSIGGFGTGVYVGVGLQRGDGTEPAHGSRGGWLTGGSFLVPDDPVLLVPVLPTGGLFAFGEVGAGLTTACAASLSAAKAADDGAMTVRTSSVAPATSHGFGE